jgi:hypothetical protein
LDKIPGAKEPNRCGTNKVLGPTFHRSAWVIKTRHRQSPNSPHLPMRRVGHRHDIVEESSVRGRVAAARHRENTRRLPRSQSAAAAHPRAQTELSSGTDCALFTPQSGRVSCFGSTSPLAPVRRPVAPAELRLGAPPTQWSTEAPSPGRG